MVRPDQVMALYRSHFPAFLRFAFRELNGGAPLVETWHVDALAERLSRFATGAHADTARLLVNAPPRSLKSFSASIALPVWLLGRDPRLAIQLVGGSREQAHDLAERVSALAASPRCRGLFPHLKFGGKVVGGRGDLTLEHGGRLSFGIAGGTVLARPTDLIIVDAPLAPAYARDDARRRAVNKWFEAEIMQRVGDARTAVVVVMHRLFDDDLSGYLLAGEQRWQHLNFAAVAAEDETWALPLGRTHRRSKGHPLAPALESKTKLFTRMLEIGAYAFGAHYQQKPFRHVNDDEMRGGCFSGPDDEWGFPPMWFGRVSERRIMAYEVFGIGAYNPGAPPRTLSQEEWERYSRWTDDYQRRLRDDAGAKFGPPEGETWPPRGPAAPQPRRDWRPEGDEELE